MVLPPLQVWCGGLDHGNKFRQVLNYNYYAKKKKVSFIALSCCNGLVYNDMGLEQV